MLDLDTHISSAFICAIVAFVSCLILASHGLCRPKFPHHKECTYPDYFPPLLITHLGRLPVLGDAELVMWHCLWQLGNNSCICFLGIRKKWAHTSETCLLGTLKVCLLFKPNHCCWGSFWCFALLDFMYSCVIPLVEGSLSPSTSACSYWSQRRARHYLGRVWKGVNQHNVFLRHAGDVPVQAGCRSALTGSYFICSVVCWFLRLEVWSLEDTHRGDEHSPSAAQHGYIYFAMLHKLQVAGQKLMWSGKKNNL